MPQREEWADLFKGLLPRDFPSFIVTASAVLGLVWIVVAVCLSFGK